MVRCAMFSKPLVAHRAHTGASGAPGGAQRNAPHDDEERRERAQQNQHGRSPVLEVKVANRSAIPTAGTVVERRTAVARRDIVLHAWHAAGHLRRDSDAQRRLLEGDVGVLSWCVAGRAPLTTAPDAGRPHDRLTVWMTGDNFCSLFFHSSRVMRTELRVTPNRAVKARIMSSAYVIRRCSAVPICTCP